MVLLIALLTMLRRCCTSLERLGVHRVASM